MKVIILLLLPLISFSQAGNIKAAKADINIDQRIKEISSIVCYGPVIGVGWANPVIEYRHNLLAIEDQIVNGLPRSFTLIKKDSSETSKYGSMGRYGAVELYTFSKRERRTMIYRDSNCYITRRPFTFHFRVRGEPPCFTIPRGWNRAIFNDHNKIKKINVQDIKWAVYTMYRRRL